MNKQLLQALTLVLLFSLFLSCATPQDTSEHTEKYRIHTVVQPQYTGWFEIEPDKNYYTHGEEISITLHPNGRFSFAGWGGDLDPDLPNPVTDFRVTDHTTIIAHLNAGYIADKPILSPKYNVYYQKLPRDLIFTIHQNTRTFNGVNKDGNPIPYSVQKLEDLSSAEPLPDSKIITISSDVFDDWSNGTHQIDFTFDDAHSLSSTIEVVAEADFKDDMTIATLFVDHGGATIIKLPNDEIMMIDTGTRVAAERYVVPFLKEYLPKDEHGNQRIDHIFITHWHYDHFEGLRAVLPEFEVGKVYFNLAYSPNEFGAYNDAENPNDPYGFADYGFPPVHNELLTVGNTLEGIGGDNVEISVLNSPVFDQHDDTFEFYDTRYFESYDGRNNRSLSLRIEYNGFVYTHGGDIYQHAQRAILNTFPDLARAHVYHGNHHFHGGVDDDYMIQKDPQLVLISANDAIYDRGAYTTNLLQNIIPELHSRNSRFAEAIITFETGHSVIRIDGNKDWQHDDVKVPYETYSLDPDTHLPTIRIPGLFE